MMKSSVWRATNLLEVRQKVVPCPSEIAQLLPGVVVTGRAAVEEHAIDDSASANYGAGIDWACSTIKLWLWNTLVIARVLLRHR